MVNNENITTFVQRILGCGCPEEVFRYIECQSDIKINDLAVKNRINIGNRLLIYVAEVNESAPVSRILPLLCDAGKKDRDSSGFNRFRLVLAADILDDIKQDAEDIFKAINEDEKMHLHVILKNSIPAFAN
ncbi:MAG: hypothetical protein FJ240_10495 [Nitrospira sp.]|nr:hypothetical protein [Nitrospira sp.]